MKLLIQHFIHYHRYLLYFEKTLVRFILLSIIVLSFSQVVIRNLFSMGFMWLDELFKIGLLWLAFIGAALATEYHRHIKIEILSRQIQSAKMNKIIEISVLMFTSSICILLLVAAIQLIVSESRYSISLLFRGIPDWIFLLIIPYAFLVMAVRYIVYIGKIFYGDQLQIEPEEEFESKLKGML